MTADMVWREIGLLVDHGATPMAAIQAATGVAARLLGIDDETGTIKPGRLADLVLVERRSARGSRAPGGTGARRAGRSPVQRRMRLGMSGSGPRQRSSSSVANRP